jgi:hypothetical protein
MGRIARSRVRLLGEGLDGLRGKMGFYLNTINLFTDSLTLSAVGGMKPILGNIERMLGGFVKEARAGHKARTVPSARDVNNRPA